MIRINNARAALVYSSEPATRIDPNWCIRRRPGP